MHSNGGRFVGGDKGGTYGSECNCRPPVVQRWHLMPSRYVGTLWECSAHGQTWEYVAGMAGFAYAGKQGGVGYKWVRRGAANGASVVRDSSGVPVANCAERRSAKREAAERGEKVGWAARAAIACERAGGRS